MVQRYLSYLLSTIFILTVLIGCGDDLNDRSTNLRFVNAVEGVGSVDMTVDSDEYLQDVGYLESTDYLEFDTDPHLLQLTPSNSLTPIDTLQVSLSDDVDSTYFACGDSSEPSAILLQDNNEPAGDASFKARVVNLFKSDLRFDVYVEGVNSASAATVNGSPTVRASGYKSASGYSVGRAGEYVITLTAVGSDKVLARASGQKFVGRGVYSILIVSESGEIAGSERGLGVRVLKDGGEG
jgi:hypothetical protein